MWWLLDKFKGYLAAAGALIVLMGYVFVRGRKEGRQAVEAEARKANQQVQEKWDEIDNRKPDLDAALDELRKRSKR